MKKKKTFSLLNKTMATGRKSKSTLKMMSENKDICTICENQVKAREKGIGCEKCDQWWHIKCLNIKEDHYDFICSNKELCYICKDCKNKPKKEDEPNSTLLNQMSQIMEKINKVIENNDRVLKSNCDLELRVKKLEKEGSVKEEQVKHIVNKSVNDLIEGKMKGITEEIEERERRKENIIIVNIPESNKDTPEERLKEDTEKIKKLFEKVTTVESDTIKKITRIGKKEDKKSRLIRVQLNSQEKKSELMKKQRELNNEETKPRDRIYINNDLTNTQREEDRKLRQELQQRKKDGETNLKIRNGKIIKEEPTRTD